MVDDAMQIIEGFRPISNIGRKTVKRTYDEKKNLLIYAHYYVPDMASTGQIIKELAESLLDRFHVTVICVVPSYLGTIKEKYKAHKYYEDCPPWRACPLHKCTFSRLTKAFSVLLSRRIVFFNVKSYHSLALNTRALPVR